MIPVLARDRLRSHTPAAVNEQIDRRAEAVLRRYARNQVNGISERIGALGQEWDAERALYAGSAAFALLGTLLAIASGRRGFLVLPGAALPVALHQALTGWSWPAVALRARYGLRTQAEIDVERAALKALRGDYGSITGEADDPGERVRQALQAAGRVRW